jgi:hypothetical protein
MSCVFEEIIEVLSSVQAIVTMVESTAVRTDRKSEIFELIR